MILQFLTLNMSIWFPMFWRTWSQVRGLHVLALDHGQWLWPQSFFNLLSYFLNCPKYCPGKRHFLSQVPHCLKVFKIKQGGKMSSPSILEKFWKDLTLWCKKALRLFSPSTVQYIFICIRGVDVLICLQIWCMIIKIWVKNDCVYIIHHFPSHVFFFAPPPPPIFSNFKAFLF